MDGLGLQGQVEVGEVGANAGDAHQAGRPRKPQRTIPGLLWPVVRRGPFERCCRH